MLSFQTENSYNAYDYDNMDIFYKINTFLNRCMWIKLLQIG